MKIGRGSTSHFRGACLVVACLSLSGCAGGADRAAGTPHSSDAPSAGDATSVSPNGGPTGQAIAAYRAMWQDMAAASATADPQLPRLADHADGDALSVLKYGVTKAQNENVVAKGAPRVDPWVVSADEHSVKLQDCVDGTHWLQYTKSGTLKNDRPGGHSKAVATVTYENGVWKVTYLYVYGEGTCG